jgi:hypothetical protein
VRLAEQVVDMFLADIDRRRGSSTTADRRKR